MGTIIKRLFYPATIAIASGFVYWVGSMVSTRSIVEATPGSNALLQYIEMSIVVVLFSTVWYLLLSAGAALKNYALKIKGAKEAPAFMAYAHGLLALFIALLFTAYLNMFRVPTLTESTYGTLTTIIYLLSGLMALIYFYQFGKAGFILSLFVKKTRHFFAFFALNLIVIATITSVIWRRFDSGQPVNYDHLLGYQPEWIVLTLLILLVFAWSFGLAGAMGLYNFYINVKGNIYKKAVKFLSIGLGVLVLVSLLRHLNDYSYGSISQQGLLDDFFKLLILFVIVITSVLFVRLGTKNLTKLEDV